MANYLTKEQIEKLIEKETKITKDCLDKLSKDMSGLRASQKRIERVLLGDKDYDDKGIAYMVNYSYDYARRNTETHLVERGENSIKLIEKYKENGYWKIFEEIIDKYKAIKWLSVVVTTSGVVSFANILYMIIKLLAE